MSRRFSNDEIPAAFRGASFRGLSGRIVTLLVALGVAVLVILTGFSVVQRVDPGYTAIVVDYSAGTEAGKPRFSQAPTGSFFLVNPLTQRVAKYSLAQNTLTMVRSTAEGKVSGDDSVECNDVAGVRINIDSSTLWRVKPEEAGQLYFLRPNTPLVGETGGDVEDLIVRREVRSAVTVSCGTMSYDAIYGADRLKFGENVRKLLQTNLDQQHIAVDSFLVGEVYLQPELAKAIADKVNAQQAAQQAAFLKQKAENEASANVAAAEGQKKVRILQGEAEAQYIQSVNAQLASAPQYIQYIFSSKWNGTLPITLITDGKSTPLLQLPTQPVTPTVTSGP
jgi:regulator of protease activity HflC (stomatin/prohibitin superfamily)